MPVAVCAWLKTMLSNAWRNQLRNARIGSTDGSVLDPDEIPDTDPRIEIDEAEYRTYLVKRWLTDAGTIRARYLESVLGVRGQ